MSAEVDYDAGIRAMDHGPQGLTKAIDAACADVIAERDELASKLVTAELAASGAQQLREVAEAERDRYREALERLATWEAHDQFVAGWEARFMHARQIAREALKGADDDQRTVKDAAQTSQFSREQIRDAIRGADDAERVGPT